MDALVTIGLPVFNGGETLAGALDALLGQTFAQFHLIISDNASTDDTQAICEARTAVDERIEYRRRENNVGMHANFVDVLRRATTPFFVWAAHDDLWEPQFLEKLVAALDDDPPAALAAPDYDVYVHATGEHVTHDAGWMPAVDPALGPRETTLRLLRAPQPTFIYGVFRTDALKAAFLTARSFDFGDLALVMRIGLHGGIRYVPEVLFHAGVPAGKTGPYSMARRRLPGLKLSYGPYLAAGLRAIAAAPSLSFRDRGVVTFALLRQVATFVQWHEWRSRRS